jgi:predicted negative regulator of RcsB-dependent stress response
VSRDDWYRLETWDDSARQAFETRLSRSRTPFHRAQYLRIQGVTLASTGKRREVAAGRALLERVIEDFPDEVLEVAGAHYALAESFVDSNLRAAIEQLRACLSFEHGRSFSHRTELRLAELLLEDDPTDATLEEVTDLLNTAESEAFFHVEAWRIAVARARLHSKQGDRDSAATQAKRALALLADNTPKLSRHQDVGLIEPDRKTVKEMRKLAG